MAFLKRVTPYAIAVLLLSAFYVRVPPPLGKTPYEHLQTFSLYRADLPSVQATPYEYLLFVVQWPFGLCAIRNCTYEPLPNNFTIHGIWPANFSDAKLKCAGTKFSRREMDKQQQLQNDLRVSWPDLESKDNMTFWKKEYNKHGRCCDNIFNQTVYFQRAHQMWSENNVKEMFEYAGYTPGNEYEPAKLKDAVKQKTNMYPALRCRNYTENNSRFNKLLLLEVVICYNRNGVTEQKLSTAATQLA